MAQNPQDTGPQPGARQERRSSPFLPLIAGILLLILIAMGVGLAWMAGWWGCPRCVAPQAIPVAAAPAASAASAPKPKRVAKAPPSAPKPVVAASAPCATPVAEAAPAASAVTPKVALAAQAGRVYLAQRPHGDMPIGTAPKAVGCERNCGNQPDQGGQQ